MTPRQPSRIQLHTFTLRATFVLPTRAQHDNESDLQYWHYLHGVAFNHVCTTLPPTYNNITISLQEDNTPTNE